MIDLVPLGSVATLNPQTPRDLFTDITKPVAFVSMSSIGEDGTLKHQDVRQVGELLQGYTYFADGDVVVAKITPCLQNGKAALLSGLKSGHGFGSTEFHVLRAGPKLDKRYLFYMVWSPDFRRFGEQRFTGSAGQKRMPATAVAEFGIPIPFPDDPRRSLAEQKRIAAILDKADAIRRRRQEAARLADDLLMSGFHHIVGPLAKGYRSWTRGTVESLACSAPGSMRTGPFGSDLRHSEFVGKGVAVLGIDNAVQNRFAWGERRFITHEKYERLQRYTVKPHDVIVTIMGTTGRSAVVPDDIPLAITTKHLATITVNRDVAEPEFVSHSIYRHPEVLAQIAGSHRGAIMPGLNLGLIRRLELPIPPPDEQRAFTRLVHKVRELEVQHSAAQFAADSLFDSLVQGAFGGQL